MTLLTNSIHILSYGTLLGTSIFQSFISGIIAFRVLPRPQFSTLQQRIFPLYFSMQTLLPLITLLTHPAGPSGAAESTAVLATLGSSTACGLANWAVVGPATTATMRKRKAQETKEGKKYWEEGEKSPEMAALNKRFGMLHGISSLLNLVEIIGLVWYGVILAAKL